MTKFSDQVDMKPATMELLSNRWVDWLNDPDVVKFSNQRNRRHTLESQREFITDPASRLFGIFLAGEHIGMAELGNIDTRRCSAEVRYLIGEKKLWGQGIASFAVQKIIEESVRMKFVNLLEAGAAPQNVGSIRVLEKNGFDFVEQRNEISWFAKKIKNF